MKKILIHLTVLAICVSLILSLNNLTVTGILVGIISGILIIYVDKFANEIDRLKHWLIAIRYRNTYIRLSISYLFRIKVKDKYLLIQGRRFPQLQPVGGVYKRLSGSVSFFQDIGALDDHLVPIDPVSQDDLRIRIKGKNLVVFLNWFDSEKDRETSPWREFYEELVKPGHFPEDLFPYIYHRHIKRYEHPFRFSKYSDSYELLIADIYEFIPSPTQLAFLEEMYTNGTNCSNIEWVEERRIRYKGAIHGEEYSSVISEHSSWII